MSAGGFYSSHHNSGAHGSGRIEDHADYDPPRYETRRGYKGGTTRTPPPAAASAGGPYEPSTTAAAAAMAKRSTSSAQLADSLKTIYPADLVHSSKGDKAPSPQRPQIPDSDHHPSPMAAAGAAGSHIKQAPKESQYAWKVAMDAANALGRGFDVTSDFRLGFAKGASGSRLVAVDEANTQDIVAPGNVVIPGVSVDIRCDKGEKTHYASEVLTFAQVSNPALELSLFSPSFPSLSLPACLFSPSLLW